MPRPRRLIPNESTYDSITSYCGYRKCGILRFRVAPFKCRNAATADAPNEHIAVASEKHAGLVFCVFQLSSTSESGRARTCSARHVIQTTNNTRFAQMTFMSRNIFFFFCIFDSQDIFSVQCGDCVCVTVCGQSKSRTCMNLSAAATANEMPFTNAGRRCNAHTARTTNGRQATQGTADRRVCLASIECVERKRVEDRH